MKYLFLTILLSALISSENLKAIPSQNEEASSSSYSASRRSSFDKSIEEIDIEGGNTEEKSNAPKKRKQSLDEFQDEYFLKMSKVFFVLQRLSRFTKFGSMTISAGLSGVAIWNDSESEDSASIPTNTSTRSTGLNSTVLILTLISIGSSALDMYATNFLSEVQKRQQKT